VAQLPPDVRALFIQARGLGTLSCCFSSLDEPSLVRRALCA
jgi:hypothetical protein